MRYTVLIALSTVCWAQTAPSNDTPRLTFEHYQLSNGMQVILHVDRKLPSVHVNLRYRVGSKHERPGRAGFAHLFEHMMFETHDPSVVFQTLAGAIGATEVNGSTHVDSTD